MSCLCRLQAFLLRRWRPFGVAALAVALVATAGVARVQAEDYQKDEALAAATLTLPVDHLTLRALLGLGELQTGFRFVYVKSELPLAAEIQFGQPKNLTLAAALNAASHQAGVLFHRTNRQIAVRAAGSAAGRFTLSGYVRDFSTKRFILGATVMLVESRRIAVTDQDGHYAFPDLPGGQYTVQVDSLGYETGTQPVLLSDDRPPRADFALSTDTVTLGQMVVEGNREGSARALQEKRTADSIMDVVSSDSVGQLPDGNAAEAVRRLPGVFARIDQNEGRFIVVRGVDPKLNNVTINGLPAGSPGGGDRGAQMDAVPAELINRIEVIKAVTPDMDAQAVGGTINIVTTSAFDRAEPFAYGTLAGGSYHGPTGEFRKNGFTPFGASATVGTQFGDGKWGLVLGASYDYRHYISNRRSGGGTWAPSGPAGSPGDHIYFPDTQSLYHYDVQRWRQGENLNLEYRPDSDHEFYLRAVNNRFQDDEGRDLNSFQFYGTTYPDSFTATSAHFSSGKSTIEYRHYLQKHRINHYSVGGKDKLDGGALQADYAFSVGDTGIRVPQRLDWQFVSPRIFQSEIDTSHVYWKVTPEAAYYDLANYPLKDVNIRSDSQYEHIYNAIANLKGDYELAGRTIDWQLGGKYFWHRKGWNRINQDYGPPASAWTLGQYAPVLTDAPYTIFGGEYPMTRRIDFDRAQQFFRNHPELFAYNPASSISDSYANYFRIDEDIGAGYGMAKVHLARDLSLLAGVRLEDTRVHVEGVEIPTQNGVRLAPRAYSGDGRYLDTLPGLHLRYTPAKHLQFRAAWTNTVGRPNYSDIGVSRSFTYTQDTGATTYTGIVTDGNPDLKPWKSMNYDASAEYYFHNGGIVSVGLFAKDITNPIYTYSYMSRNAVFDGLSFSQLSYTKPLNANRGKIRGLELNYQQQLTMLPSPLDGLGYALNYSDIDSSESLPTRPGEKLPFASQARQLYNAAIIYEKYGFEARLAVTYTGAYVLSFGSSINGDDYESDRKIVDGKVSYRLNRHLTCFVDVINLGQEPLDEYAGRPSQNSATEHYWWTANFGFNWKL